VACEPITVQKSIIVSGYEQRGTITGSDIVNPGAEPGRFPGGNAYENGGNWYESCLTNAASNGFNTNVNYNWTIQQVAGPSLGEEGKNFPSIYFWWQLAVSGSVPGYNLTVLNTITNGCVSGGGGPVTGVRIIDSGNYLTVDDQTIWNLQGSGKDGQIRLTIQPETNNYPSVSRTLRSIELTNPGSGYRVGDTTGISGLDFSPSVQEQAFVEVTSVQAQTSVYVNHYHIRQTDPDKNFGLSGGDGWAIGDRFALVLYPIGSSPGDSPFNDNNAIYEVTAIDVTNTVESDATLQYTVEAGVKLVYDISSNDRIVDLVTEYDESSTTDPILQESASEVFRIWLQFLGRKPTDLEFQYYVRQFYDAGGQTTPEISESISNQFATELDNNVVQILSSCQQDDGNNDGSIDSPPDGTSCVWDRNDFYQGAGTSAGTNVQLKHLWDFLGQPNGPSGPGGGASVDEIVCPKPESGQIDDNEPDISDFAGMRLWRWLQCTDGSNGANPDLGGYQEIIVPCPGPSEGCTNPETEDDLAVYYQSAKITWNDGSSLTGNFVKTAKTGQAQEITNTYQTLFGRNPEQAGLNYWNDITNETIEDEYAIYWKYGYVKWNDGSANLAPLFKQAKTSNALAINNQYLNILGRPAEQAGMQLWANEADSIGIANTLNNIEIAAEAELGRGGINKVEYGITRTKSLIAEAGAPELLKNGVDSFKLFCETQVSAQVDLGFFINTRVPPTYGTITIQPPTIFAPKTSDTMYLNYVPESQTENVGGFAASNGQGNRKYGFDNEFEVAWNEPQGDLFGAPPPIVVRFVEGEYIKDDGSVVDLTMPAFRDWGSLNAGSVDIDDLMVPIVGNRNSIQFDTSGTDWAGSLGTSVGLGETKTLENFEPFTVYKPLYPDGTSDDPVVTNIDDAKRIAFNENPNYGFKHFWRIKAVTYCFDPETLELIPGLTAQDSFEDRVDSRTNRFLTTFSSPATCPNGTQTCPDGSVICIEDTCDPGPGVGPGGGGCNSLSISCGQNTTLYKETNEPTTIRFSYRVNNYSSCDVNGSATVSIRKYWPCPVFGPPSGAENQWVVKKRSVSINSSGDAVFDLQINTAKDDYLPTILGDQTVDDPGVCHWVYVAYWEVNGMSSTSINCNYSAWDNPGCDYSTVFNFLDEILCVQQQNCLNDPDGNQDCTGSEASQYYGPDDIDPGTCLPYCDTSNDNNFYWCCPDKSPEPGVNCVIRGSGPGSGAPCTSDCPVCEQTIQVFIGDTTECGPLKKPGLIEGTGPGNNNATVEVGGTVLGITTRNEAVIARDVAGIFTRQLDGVKAFPIKLEQWVSLASVTVQSETVEGKDAAVDFSGQDISGTYQRCCESFEASFECYDLPPGWCEDYEAGTIEGGIEIDCNAEVRVGATWWVVFKYKRDDGSTYTTSNQINFYSNWDTPDEEPRILIPTDYWPIDAGNGANGLPMDYAGRVGGLSYYTGSGFTYLPIYDNSIGYEIYIEINASNDHWWMGGERGSEYHPPPPGFNEGDFGTDRTVSSPRPPWNIGTQGPGPKDQRFLVAKFKITDDVSLPTVDWTAVLEGCEDAQVYDRYDFWTNNGLTCGEPGQPGYYNCEISGLGQYQESWINYDGTTGGSLVFGCDPWDNAPDPTCAPPLSSVVITLNTTDGSGLFGINYDGLPTTGLRVLWYLNGKLVSAPSSTDSFDVSNCLSCGDKSFDFSGLVTDAETLYTVEAVILMNSSTPNSGTPLVAYKDPRDVPEEDRWKSSNYALQRGSFTKPINVVDDIQEGEYWQVILGGASCTFQGNDGSVGGKKLTGLQAPNFTIQSYDNGAPDENCLTASDTECCDPRYADNNPTNRCEELILGGIINCCEGDNGDFGTGKLRVNLENGTNAWPFIPGTQERVVGSIRYYWEQQDNANNWNPVTGGTGDAISIVRDGRSYRVTVTYDVTTAPNFPSGYTADPATTQTTKSITPSADGYETCPDGSSAPIGQCEDSGGPCDQPVYQPNEFVAPLQAVYNQLTYEKITVPNNTNVSSVVTIGVNGFNNVNYVSGTARLKLGNNLSAAVNLGVAAGEGTNSYFLVASPTVVTGSNETRTYQAQITIRYQCQDTQEIRSTTFNVGSMEITWGGSGPGPGPGSDEYPKLISPPECFFGAGYTNSSGCGSYLAQWQDSAGSAFKYYYHNVKNDVNLTNRGAEYSAGVVEQYAKCDFCPSTSCPSVKITSVTINPNPPQVNQTVTLQLNYNWNPNGFTPTTNPFLNNGLYEQITWTFPDGTSQTGAQAQINVGPYTSEGERKFTVTIAKFYDDPTNECAQGDGFVTLSGIVTDSYEFIVDVGGTGPGPGPGEDPVEPSISGTITGDRNLTLSNGTAVGNYQMDYVLNEGVGYQPSTREVTVAWDGGPAKWYDRDNGRNYQRTFTDTGGVEVVGKVAKLFAKPGYTGPLDSPSIIDAGQQKWVVDNVVFNVQVNPEGGTSVLPSSTMTMTQSTNRIQLVNGEALVRFSAQATVNDGTYTPTPEPTALRYNIINGDTGTSALAQNVLSKNWSHIFTQAGTYTVEARYRKNYCAEGLTECTGTTPGKIFTADSDSVTVVVEAEDTGPVGQKPSATLLSPPEYTDVNGNVLSTFEGCAYSQTRVLVYFTISTTAGTGDYVFSDIDVVGSPLTWTAIGGGKWQASISRGQDASNTIGGNIVSFKNSNGEEVHSERIGTVDWCVIIIDDPFNPQGPGDFDLQ